MCLSWFLSLRGHLSPSRRALVPGTLSKAGWASQPLQPPASSIVWVLPDLAPPAPCVSGHSSRAGSNSRGQGHVSPGHSHASDGGRAEGWLKRGQGRARARGSAARGWAGGTPGEAITLRPGSHPASRFKLKFLFKVYFASFELFIPQHSPSAPPASPLLCFVIKPARCWRAEAQGEGNKVRRCHRRRAAQKQAPRHGAVHPARGHTAAPKPAGCARLAPLGSGG